MKILSTISLNILIGIAYLTQKTSPAPSPAETRVSENCLEHVSLFNSLETRIVHCPLVSPKEKRAPASPDDMFKVDFQCLVGDKALCDKVEDVFKSAGKFITATVNLKSVVNVNAQFLDFCESYGNCNNDGTGILGAAKPSKYIPYQDPTDGKLRFYPQALYKQMELRGRHPQLEQSDITAIFNSRMNFWFPGDPLPLAESQADMLFVVLHELIHGLGFINSWNDYFGIQALTPAPTLIDSESQFFEYTFDKSLILLPSGKPLTSITDQLNHFQVNAIDDESINLFKASPQFSIAHDMYENAMVHGSIGFLITPDLPLNTQLTQDQIQNNFVILETSLNPFESSSSIGHVDYETYLNTSDFLMMFTYPKTATLGDMMSKAGSTTTTGPIGPKLRLILKTLGYNVNEAYSPPSIKNNSSLISFNLVLTLVCVLLTLIYNI